MRDTFTATVDMLLKEDPRAALVLADISASRFEDAAARHPDRVINVGIREQLMIGVAGGMALSGLRPIAHSYATFVVDRAYEQVKLDLAHQGVGAVLVSVGASYDGAEMGYTHFSPMDVALLDTLPGWRIHVPGHPSEIGPLLAAAMGDDDPVYIRLSTQVNQMAVPVSPRLTTVRRGGGPTVVAVGPMLDPVLEAVGDLDATVAYAQQIRPFDAAGLRALAGDSPDVVLVEPTLAGTSTRVVMEALAGLPAKVLALGVGRVDLHRYGTPADHAAWHGLDAAGLRRSITSRP